MLPGITISSQPLLAPLHLGAIITYAKKRAHYFIILLDEWNVDKKGRAILRASFWRDSINGLIKQIVEHIE